MSTFHKLLGLSAAVLLAVPLAASAITDAERQAGRQSVANQPVPVAMAAPAPDARMTAMRDMRDRMAAARTPEERQALMAEHMLAMQNGMQMMKTAPGMPGMSGMSGTSGMSGMGPMGGMGGMADNSGRPAKAAKPAAKGMSHNMAGHMAMHHQMMESRMDAMQTMMDMMMQRMAPADAASR
jgi:hypothetical protein